MAKTRDGKLDQVMGWLRGLVPVRDVAASTSLFAGTIAAINTAGNQVNATGLVGLRIFGRNEKGVTRGSDVGPTNPQSEACSGAFWVNNTTGIGTITKADLFKNAYLVDNDTVSRHSASGTLPYAGLIVGVGVTGDQAGKVAIAPLMVSPYDIPPAYAANLGEAFKCRGVGPATDVADLGAFTVASNDGLTYVAGDVVWLYTQTAKAEDGPYVVGTVASGAAPLTRPWWWPAGGSIRAGTVVEIAVGGTLFGGSSWKVMHTAAITVDTDDPKGYPRFVCQQIQLSSGTATVSNVPLFSATKSQVKFSRTTPSTPSNTLEYNPVTLTPGAVGTASIVVNAQVAAGTINASDGSTGNFSVWNW